MAISMQLEFLHIAHQQAQIEVTTRYQKKEKKKKDHLPIAEK